MLTTSLAAVFPGCHAVYLLEVMREIGGVGEAAALGDQRDGQVAVPEQIGRMVDAHAEQEFREAEAGRYR